MRQNHGISAWLEGKEKKRFNFNSQNKAGKADYITNNQHVFVGAEADIVS